MAEKPLLLLSMKDSKAVANAMSNEKAQKIISYLAENKEATESEISEKLKIPLPTVHYNIQQLKKAKLIEAKEFFWSKKGKHMLVYRLAKKYIVISPDTSSSALSKLKNLLPITLLSLVGSGLIYLYQKTKPIKTMVFEGGGEVVSDASQKVVDNAAMDMIAGAEGSGQVVDAVANATSQVVTLPEPNYALWFLVGSLFVIILIFLINSFRK